MEDKRQVSRERGEAVGACLIFFACLLFLVIQHTSTPTGAALLEYNEASAKLTTANGGTFTSS